MLPTLQPGQEVLCAMHHHPVGVGDIVVALHPAGDRHLIKRVASVGPQGAYELLGDNAAESTDSRTLGPFNPDQVLGRVTSVLPT